MTSETGYLGFANLPNQVHRKSVKKGFEFTLMVVGESGLGKSTLINCMFQTNMYTQRKIPMVAEKLSRTLEIVTNNVDIEEKGVKLKLTVVDTPGYGDALDCSNGYGPILNYIDEQYERFLNHESGLNRRHITDSRAHCCFYFISPENYGLKPSDIQFMKLLHNKVNVVPIIAKADFLTKDELKAKKSRILAEIKSNHIQIYTIPDCDADEDEEYKDHVRQLKNSVPFAVIGSIDTYDVKGKAIRGRQYPWGVVEVENPDHSDFVKLRSMLVTHMQDLREVTQDVHYENYRSQRLAGKITAPDIKDNISVTSGDEEKDRILMEKDAELKKMQEMIAKMKQQMQQQENSGDVKHENGANGVKHNV